MGADADRTVREIEEARQKLDADLRDLETRLPRAARSLKSLVGVVIGSTALALFVLGRLRPKRAKDRPTEVVVRIVREDS